MLNVTMAIDFLLYALADERNNTKKKEINRIRGIDNTTKVGHCQAVKLVNLYIVIIIT